MSGAEDEAAGRDTRRAARAAFVGTVVEYYDFSLYASAAATVFATVYFPGSSPGLAAVQSIATFAVAFLVRPIGGALAGSIGDRFGRKRVLIASLVLMGLATTCIAFVPGFATIGWAAPMLLVLLRILQGLGASAEFGGATLVAVEFAPQKRRGLLGSLVGAGCSLGGLLGTSALLIASLLTSQEQFLAWGWRVPFVLSLLLVGYGLWLRRSLPETPVFRAVDEAGLTSDRPVREVIRTRPGTLLGIVALFFSAAGLGYFYVVFMVSYATTNVGLSRQTALIGLLVAQLSCAVLTAVFGWLSDHVDRRVVMLAGLGLSVALAFPFFGLIRVDWPVGLWIGMFLGNGVAVAALFGPMGTYAAELLPGRLRYSAMGVARETGNMIGAAVVPLVAAHIAAGVSGTLGLSSLLILVAVLGAAGFLLASPRKDADLVEEERPGNFVG